MDNPQTHTDTATVEDVKIQWLQDRLAMAQKQHTDELLGAHIRSMVMASSYLGRIKELEGALADAQAAVMPTGDTDTEV